MNITLFRKSENWNKMNIYYNGKGETETMRLDFHAVRAFASGDDETPIMTKYFKDWDKANRWADRQAEKYKAGAVNFEADYTAHGCDYKEHKWIHWEDHWSNKD